LHTPQHISIRKACRVSRARSPMIRIVPPAFSRSECSPRRPRYSRALSAATLAASLAFADGVANAQTFPVRPVRIIVPTTPGGTLDFLTRLLAPKLSEQWRQPVVVDNRAGAGGIIGYEVAAHASPDGHTFAMVASTFSVTAAVYRKLPYDALRDFAPVSLVTFSPWALVVNPSLPVTTVNELVALSKRRPGRINYASTGTGGATHLAVELLKSMTGADLTHVPYKGTAPAVGDVVSGQVQLIITGLTGTLPQVNAGKLRLIAVTGRNRTPSLPNVPTIGESVPGYEYNNWFGALAPRGTASGILAALQTGISRALQSTDTKQALAAQSLDPVGSSPAQFGEMLRQEIAKYTQLAKEIRVQLD